MSVPRFELADEIKALQDAAQRLAEHELAPRVRESEQAGCWPDEVLRVLDQFELGGLDLPVELGGAGAGATAKVVVLEALAAGDPGGLPAADRPGPAVGAVIAAEHHPLGAAALVVADPDDDRRPAVDWAPAWPSLEWAWVIRGDHLQLHGITATSPVVALGFRASGGITAELDAQVAGVWELPPGEGANIRGRARLWSAAALVGIGQAAFDATVTYATERVVFGRPVAHHQGNAFDLAVAATDVHAARLAVRAAAGRFDAGDPYAGFWATEAWKAAVAVGIRITDLGVQLLGGHGFLVDHLAEKRFREARMAALLFGGQDSADADLAAQVLEIP